MIYGYARVSTIGQGKNGTSLEEQRKQLKEHGAQIIYKDVYTGSKMKRPELEKLLSIIQSGDTLIVTKLDRFARNATEGGELIENLHSRGIIIEILNMGRVDDTPMGKLMIHILLAFAEFERTQINERLQAGKAAARQKGIRVDGAPQKYDAKRIQTAMRMLDEEHLSYSEVVRRTGISKSTLIRNHNKRKA